MAPGDGRAQVTAAERESAAESEVESIVAGFAQIWPEQALARAEESAVGDDVHTCGLCQRRVAALRRNPAAVEKARSGRTV